jgi:hypothetical protein
MDLLLIETLNGGDLYKKGNDLLMIPGWQNMPYLAMFGGNVEAVTKARSSGEEDFSWWGNNLLMQGNSSIQFNSLTENALKNTPLTSAGRVVIQKAVERDLDFMKEFAVIKVTVSIVGPNRVQINIDVLQPSGKVSDQYKPFIFIWDGTLQTLTGDFDISDFNKNDFFV